MKIVLAAFTGLFLLSCYLALAGCAVYNVATHYPH